MQSPIEKLLKTPSETKEWNTNVPFLVYTIFDGTIRRNEQMLCWPLPYDAYHHVF